MSPRFAVFGHPVAHSLSPRMHNAAYAALGLDYVYVPFRAAPDAIRQAFMDAMASVAITASTGASRDDGASTVTSWRPTARTTSFGKR